MHCAGRVRLQRHDLLYGARRERERRIKRKQARSGGCNFRARDITSRGHSDQVDHSCTSCLAGMYRSMYILAVIYVGGRFGKAVVTTALQGGGAGGLAVALTLYVSDSVWTERNIFLLSCLFRAIGGSGDYSHVPSCGY